MKQSTYTNGKFWSLQADYESSEGNVLWWKIFLEPFRTGISLWFHESVQGLRYITSSQINLHCFWGSWPVKSLHHYLTSWFFFSFPLCVFFLSKITHIRQVEDERLNLFFSSAKSNSILRQSCSYTMEKIFN